MLVHRERTYVEFGRITVQNQLGTLTLNSDGSFNYTPAAGVTGQDSFTYTISDGTFLTASATVHIMVQPQQQPSPPPHVVVIAGLSHSRKGLTSIAIAFDEALNPISAQNGDYGLFLGVKKRNHVVFNKIVGIRSVQYDSNTHTVAINLSKPVKGQVKVIVHGGIVAVDGATSTGDVSAVVS